jgi:hypothetical protein
MSGEGEPNAALTVVLSAVKPHRGGEEKKKAKRVRVLTVPPVMMVTFASF